jgi:hypothetical protein
MQWTIATGSKETGKLGACGRGDAVHAEPDADDAEDGDGNDKPLRSIASSTEHRIVEAKQAPKTEVMQRSNPSKTYATRRFAAQGQHLQQQSMRS